VVAAEGEREAASLGMRADGLRNGLADAADEARVLEDADGRVARLCDLLELVVAVELDGPAEALQLLNKPSLDEVDRARVNARAWLGRHERDARRGAKGGRRVPGRR
jgi:hypothetical protein